MRKLANWLSAVSLVLGALHLVHIRKPIWAGLALSAGKIGAEGLAPILTFLGLLGCGLGLLARAPLAAFMGFGGAALSARYTRAIAGARGDLAAAFGPDWQTRIPPERSRLMLGRTWPKLAPADPPAQRIPNLPFAVVPMPPLVRATRTGADRPIYCDLWLPPDGVAHTGLGLIYLHGSAWYFGDKDQRTRPFFRHLTAQGHVIMDVAYRMCPETDFRGMAGDAKRAIAWLRAHANEYGVDPKRIVISGGSAGAHLALLAAYTADIEALCPEELAGRDLSVRGVVAYYAPSDFHAMDEYYGWEGRHSNAAPLPDEGPVVPPGPGATFRQRQAYTALQARRLTQLPRHMFGGYPEEVPDAYRLASPLSHVGPHCPPTLLIHGNHDLLVPIGATRALVQALRNAGAPVDYLELPATEHGFDLFLPRISPPNQAALYEVERFLALLE